MTAITYTHPALGRLLLEGNSKGEQTLLLLFDVVDGVSNVTESTSGLAVAVGVSLELGVGLCAITRFKSASIPIGFKRPIQAQSSTFKLGAEVRSRPGSERDSPQCHGCGTVPRHQSEQSWSSSSPLRW